MRFLVIATGSKGNCAYVETPHARILIDCGVGIRRIESELAKIGADVRGIDAVLISHLHSDHTRGLPTLLKHVPARVYGHNRLVGELTRRVNAELAAAKRATYTSADIVGFNGVDGFPHRDLDILPFHVNHDCDPTVMYKVHHGGRWAGVLTDLGSTTPELTTAFGNCDALLLESNHCPQLLAAGPYPLPLKRRVAGSRGHLSNEQAAQFATGLAQMPGRLLLGHVSDTNNTVAAASAAFNRIETGQIPHTVIPQETTAQVIEL